MSFIPHRYAPEGRGSRFHPTFSILLASVITMAIIGAFVLIDEDDSIEVSGLTSSGTCGLYGKNLTWAIDEDGNLTITGSGAMDNYYSVGTKWGRNTVKTVEISEGVTSIGEYAFYECEVTTITIPNTVTSIGKYAFYGCTVLASISIPDSVMSIGECAFHGCWNLRTINIPEVL